MNLQSTSSVSFWKGNIFLHTLAATCLTLNHRRPEYAMGRYVPTPLYTRHSVLFFKTRQFTNSQESILLIDALALRQVNLQRQASRHRRLSPKPLQPHHNESSQALKLSTLGRSCRVYPAIPRPRDQRSGSSRPELYPIFSSWASTTTKTGPCAETCSADQHAWPSKTHTSSSPACHTRS